MRTHIKGAKLDRAIRDMKARLARSGLAIDDQELRRLGGQLAIAMDREALMACLEAARIDPGDKPPAQARSLLLEAAAAFYGCND